ncbi:MAG: hypothetical protein M1814_001648 [Vezdaea aestivalis]|nr:MAG: hypothetical protein M1814_001648 [Vezdaea aestivalis]
MPRLVRRKPWIEQVKSYLNPLDFLLWLSEELETSDWQLERSYSTTIGIVLNLAFIVARANSGPHGNVTDDDVFGESPERSWAGFVVHSLTIFSVTNAIYAFYRTRQYRLFESPVDAVPSTPSAHRVRVDSPPRSSSPLQHLSSVVASATAASRSHPIPSRDVWELAVWDPSPLSLRLFGLFSPAHVTIYMFILPAALNDPHPNSFILTAITAAFLLSTQLLLLQSSYKQQHKDSQLIQKEVFHEYDVKYVRPLTNQPVRDVGTQCYETHDKYNFVEIHTPTTIVNRGFKTRPNNNYAKHFDPDGVGQQKPSQPSLPRHRTTATNVFQTPLHQRDSSSPLKPKTTVRQPRFSGSRGDGGSLGVYSHASSPLKKSASVQALPHNVRQRPRSPLKEERSALKRSSLPSGGPEPRADPSLPFYLYGDGRRESGRF